MIVVETNGLVDHATRRPVKARYGETWEVDLGRLVAWATRNSIRVVVLPIIAGEARLVLRTEIETRHAKRPRNERLALYRTAERRLDEILAKLSREEPAYTEDEFDATKKWWDEHKHSLDHLVPGKDPMPDDNDIRIMLQASRLATTGRIHVFSRDAHFIGYEPEIASKFNLAVQRGAALPILLNEWGA